MKPTRRQFIHTSALGAMACLLNQSATRASAQPGTKRPNIVFILADDMGYGDIQAYNPESKIPTPHLNRLCEQGMRFTDAHSASAVCTPTRYALLMGRYSWRSRLKRGVLFPPRDEPLIDPDDVTVAGMLKSQNYHTACIGKWHLGIQWAKDEEGNIDFSQPMQYGPTDTGFDEFFGIAASLDMIPYAYYRNHDPVGPITETQEKLPFPKFVREGPKSETFEIDDVLDELTTEAVNYIERRAGEDDPFFLYFPITAPHKPTWPESRFEGATELGPYGDFIHQVDWSVGQVMSALDQAGITDNTLVIYSSDNGSYMFRRDGDADDHVSDETVQVYHSSNHTANAHLRGTKADIYEAGHRVPFIVRWPDQVTAGTTCDTTICQTDFLATCAEISGYEKPASVGEDSFSFAPLLHEKQDAYSRPPVIHHSGNGTFALRDGEWKLIFANGSGGRQKPVSKPFEKPYMLFNLQDDPSETTNVIDQHPAIAQRLEKALYEIIGETSIE